MSQAKRHHYVPQFYLRRFANAAGRIRVYRSHTQLTPILTSVKDAAVRTGFYKLADARSNDPMAIEAELSKIEGAAASAFVRISPARAWPPPTAERSALAIFMALQLMRTPEKLREFEMMTDSVEKVFYENMTPEWANKRLIEIGESPTAERIAELMAIAKNPAGYAFVPRPNEFLRVMVTTALAIAPLLAARSWWLGTSPGPALVAGDHAPVVFSLPSDGQRFLGVGIENADEVDFPLDRHHALLMFRSGLPEKTIVLERENVVFINGQIAESSHRFIFQHPDDPSIDHMIPKEPRALLVVNEAPVFEFDSRTRIRLHPIFAPHFSRSEHDGDKAGSTR